MECSKHSQHVRVARGLNAKEMGIKIALDTDAHSIDNLDFMPYGIQQARRGWLEADDVINTLSLIDLKKLLAKS